MDLISEHLDGSHIVSSFNSGNEHLDRWLRDSASRGEQHQTARTFVVHEGDKEVVGYYTLVVNVLHRDGLSLSNTLSRKLPREIGAILLAKLAVDVSIQGQGYGRDLLMEALEKCVDTYKIVACRYVVVDAIDESAAKFYERFGFDRVPDTDPVRLIKLIKDIEASLAVEA